jgi:hypothetical protein
MGAREVAVFTDGLLELLDRQGDAWSSALEKTLSSEIEVVRLRIPRADARGGRDTN